MLLQSTYPKVMENCSSIKKSQSQWIWPLLQARIHIFCMTKGWNSCAYTCMQLLMEVRGRISVQTQWLILMKIHACMIPTLKAWCPLVEMDLTYKTVVGTFKRPVNDVTLIDMWLANGSLITGNHECPIGYTKCPGSYCIAERFICDGIENCPFGEDEEDCGEPFVQNMK